MPGSRGAQYSLAAVCEVVNRQRRLACLWSRYPSSRRSRRGSRQLRSLCRWQDRPSLACHAPENKFLRVHPISARQGRL